MFFSRVEFKLHSVCEKTYFFPFSVKDDRRAADERLKREQDKVDKALQAARNTGEKDRQLKELAAQVDTLTVRCVHL